jgi:pimeloyl-ACP methyl ester carboxylesterase
LKKSVSAATALAAVSATLAHAPSASGAQAQAAGARVVWTACGTAAYPKLECGTLKVPLDHARPGGRTITLALSRVRHTSAHYQGPLLVNPGGPGASGLSLAGFVAKRLSAKVAAQYDIVGFDPRGVGASRPALNCKPGHLAPVRPDPVPHSPAEERANLRRASSFARACDSRYGTLLRHIDTASTARDLDRVRAALGARQVSYLGFSYGTYLGAVYARLFPERVRRLVLDSVVDPTGVWYADNIAQDYAFDARHKAFFAWVAKNHSTYRLGTDPGRIEAEWYRVREELRSNPAGGKVGPGEFEDTFIPGGYFNGYWPDLAAGLAAYIRGHDAEALVTLYKSLAGSDPAADNGYSVYTAVQCRDVRWPRDWPTWHRDAERVRAKAPLMAWNNAWYNAPCAFWPTSPAQPVDVANDRLPPSLLFQATDDAATPYQGGVTMHRLLRGSRLVVEEQGGNHGITLAGNACLDGYLADYLGSGRLPGRGSGAGADATCRARPAPNPAAASGAPSPTAAGTADRGRHGMLRGPWAGSVEPAAE